MANSRVMKESHRIRFIQNYLVVYFNDDIQQIKSDRLVQSIEQLGNIVNNVEMFSDPDQCIDFITNVNEEKVLMIISNEIGRKLVPMIENVHQINSIYIFSKNKFEEKEWLRKWMKVKGIFHEMPLLYETLRNDIFSYDHDHISISLVSSDSIQSDLNLDQLDPTFMYTQIIKEILLNLNFTKEHLTDLTNYYRENVEDNPIQLKSIDDFEKTYYDHPPIWWYTHQYCFYSMLNRALRLMEIDTIIKMGFFIKDIHQQISKLHVQQSRQRSSSDKFIIYRGQRLSQADFDKICKIQGGLISFNNFLSTTKDIEVASAFAHCSIVDPTSIGIIFVITSDPNIKSTPFASLDDLSVYNTEEEILFSMHTVFRIDEIMPTVHNRIFQIGLVQTDETDQQLKQLTEQLRDDIQGSNQWDKLAKVLVKLERFDKASDLYQVLLQQTTNTRDQIHFLHQLGWIKKKEKLYDESIEFYQKSIEMKEKVFPGNHHSLAASYNDLGSVYEKQQQYTKALLYYEQALQIEESISSSDQIGLASCYSKIGSIYQKIQNYTQALSFHQKALQIRLKINPNTSHVAYCHQNIASVYENIRDYSLAAQSHEKALQIQLKIHPKTHPEIAQTYHSMGIFYSKQGKFSKACQYHENALQIGKLSLPSNHPNLIKWKGSLDYNRRKLH